MYVKTTWESTTLLTPIEFNNLETQYDEITAFFTATPWRMMSSEVLITEVSSAPSTHAPGRLYFNTDTTKMYVSDGTSWIDLMEVAT